MRLNIGKRDARQAVVGETNNTRPKLPKKNKRYFVEKGCASS
jgi:hypothetical protein